MTPTPRSICWSPKEQLELPTFENADDFVAALVKREQLVVNSAVAAVLAGRSPAMSPRTLQRHFLKTTGMTHNYWQQIQRAQKAASGLQLGKSLAQVAFEAGYVDQSHMTRWLKQIVGRTPGEIARDKRPQP
jgi:transcriptional regulator GlxA family with amidase domain